ncbi:HK97 family phage major capsid protein [Skermanella aerolata]|uniref:phage major capsid protein n=1 Tax=Skermanella aerolata TaxID=393310 RepID=UPI003D1D10C4
MSLRELIEKRSRLTASMRQLLDAAAGENGDLSDEQQQQFDRQKAEAEALERQITRQQTVDDMERRQQGQPVGGTGDDRLDAEMQGLGLRDFIVAQIPDMAARVDTGRVRAVSEEIARRAGRPFQGLATPMAFFRKPVEQRVITTTTPVAGPGGNLIGTNLRSDLFIDLMWDALAIRRAGARVLTGLVGNVDIPKQTQSAIAVWFEEDTPIPLSDLAFKQVPLRPKHVGARTEFSRNMLLQSTPDIEELIRADFAALLARAVDSAAIAGTGTDAEPLGILNTPGIGSVAMGTNGGAPTWAAVLDLIGELEDSNVTGSLAFVGNGKFSRKARRTLKEAGLPGYLMDAPGNLAGYPYYSTGLVPSNLTKGTGTALSALIFGRWTDLMIGYWSEFDLLVNPYESTAYSKGNVQVRGIVTMDVAVRNPQSFAAIKDIVT